MTPALAPPYALVPLITLPALDLSYNMLSTHVWLAGLRPEVNCCCWMAAGVGSTVATVLSTGVVIGAFAKGLSVVCGNHTTSCTIKKRE